MWWMVWVGLICTTPAAAEASWGVARCGWDDFEPNDERRRARPLREGGAAAACGLDEDWFSLALERGKPVEVRVTHHPTARFRPIEVYPPRSRRSIGKAFRGPGTVGVRIEPRRSGVYRVRIRSPEAVRAAYSVTVGPPSKPASRYPATVRGRLSTR